MDATQAAQHIPIYLDWTFWAFAVAALAVVLSQLPPLHILLRRAKLEVEAYALLAITHKVGNANAQLHLIFRNTGGRHIKVTGIALRFQRGEQSFVLPAKNYLANPSDKEALLLTSFKMKPDEEWVHIVNFLNYFSRDDERQFRRLRINHRSDILAKREAEPNALVVADNASIAPLTAFFEQHFVWQPGEYQVTLEVTAVPSRASLRKGYRITLFESDTQQLRDFANDYKYGAGVWYDSPAQESVITPLNET